MVIIFNSSALFKTLLFNSFSYTWYLFNVDPTNKQIFYRRIEIILARFHRRFPAYQRQPYELRLNLRQHLIQLICCRQRRLDRVENCVVPGFCTFDHWCAEHFFVGGFAELVNWGRNLRFDGTARENEEDGDCWHENRYTCHFYPFSLSLWKNFSVFFYLISLQALKICFLGLEEKVESLFTINFRINSVLECDLFFVYTINMPG